MGFDIIRYIYIYTSRLRQLAPGGGQAGFRRMAREMDENLIRL